MFLESIRIVGASATPRLASEEALPVHGGRVEASTRKKRRTLELFLDVFAETLAYGCPRCLFYRASCSQLPPQPLPFPPVLLSGGCGPATRRSRSNGREGGQLAGGRGCFDDVNHRPEDSHEEASCMESVAGRLKNI